MGILASGGADDGKTYISSQTVQRLTEVVTSGPEFIGGLHSVQFGLGTIPVKSPLVSSVGTIDL